MRCRLILGLSFLLLPHPGQAAQSVTIAQLDQVLSADRHLSDERVYSQLAGFTLSERVTAEQLAVWQATFPGPHTQQILLLLADQSAFWPLPASDLSDPPPGSSADAKILEAALDYANRTSHNLPNLLAVRRTLHFQTSFETLATLARAAALNASATGFVGQNALPRYFTGQSHSPVTYRDGEEILANQAAARGTAGLTTSGEFGPFLTTVLGDAVQSSVTLGYWQKSGDNRLAVFRYQVPAEKSHYLVEVHDGSVTQTHPAYHGEIAVDPGTGSVLRISLVSKPEKPSEPTVGIFVEYGPVILGDRAYLVPLHAAALTRCPIHAGFNTVMPVQSYLNDVVFSQYHLFRADARIVTDGDAQPSHDNAPAGTAATPQLR